MTIAVIAKITVLEGKGDEAIAAFQPELAAVEDEESTIRYILHKDANNPDVLWFYEQYADQAALGVHGSSETMKTVGPVLKPLLASRMEFTFLDIVDGKNI